MKATQNLFPNREKKEKNVRNNRSTSPHCTGEKKSLGTEQVPERKKHLQRNTDQKSKRSRRSDQYVTKLDVSTAGGRLKVGLTLRVTKTKSGNPGSEVMQGNIHAFSGTKTSLVGFRFNKKGGKTGDKTQKVAQH